MELPTPRMYAIELRSKYINIGLSKNRATEAAKICVNELLEANTQIESSLDKIFFREALEQLKLLQFMIIKHFNNNNVLNDCIIVDLIIRTNRETQINHFAVIEGETIRDDQMIGLWRLK